MNEILMMMSRELQRSRMTDLISFDALLRGFKTDPDLYLRNIYKWVKDMMHFYVERHEDEYPNDPESIGYVAYNMDKLFLQDVDFPYLADRLFMNDLMGQIEALGQTQGQNMVYIIEGPHGCGKSTFLNNFLKKMEEYSATPAGARYEVVWKLDANKIKGIRSFLLTGEIERRKGDKSDVPSFLQVNCPNHCNPLLLVPLNKREELLDSLVEDKNKLAQFKTESQFNWFFKKEPCTICESISRAILDKGGAKIKNVYEMLYARRFLMNRRHSHGISVYNPSDAARAREVVSNTTAQELLNRMLDDSEAVRLEYSYYSQSNDGVFVLMDLKGKNKERLKDLHNVISEGRCRVNTREESIDSLFIAASNPEDKLTFKFDEGQGIADDRAFNDRKQEIQMGYIRDYETEAKFLKSVFGQKVVERFLPRVFEYFAKIVVSTRLSQESEAMIMWISHFDKYTKYCDDNLLLLKMEIILGRIPSWLSEEDRRSFTAEKRRDLFKELRQDGVRGISGRLSPKLLTELLSSCNGELISMEKLIDFFEKREDQEKNDGIPPHFLYSLEHLYQYSLLQEIKDSLYLYNEEQMGRDINNYLFALSFENGDEVQNIETGDIITVSEGFFVNIERWLMEADSARYLEPREYVHKALVQERASGINIADTKKYKHLLRLYSQALNKKSLEPVIKNPNYRGAIKAYGTKEFDTHDQKVKREVGHLIDELARKYGYSEEGAKLVCLYMIDEELARKFSN